MPETKNPELTKKSDVFSPEERAAMRNRAKELKAAAGKAEDAAANEKAIAALVADERELAERIRTMVVAAAPHLDPKTYYGFPAWAREGKVVCFFKPKSKFKVRYSTFEFDTAATLDDGAVWATAFAVHNEMTADDEKMLSRLVAKAAG
ncbi:MAG TPA: hypothetical protein VGO65_03115 [Pseudolysinimonas sp.]|jgi:uncharacterized protein YdhG (YjbR/CyaY superfamily)|nr:hypothetical protein [Pseudolysinimonas sp.]